MNLDELKEKYPLPFQLKPTQEEDIKLLLDMPSALLDLPVGYGKTCIATYTVLGHEADKVLVAVPPILTVQWVRWLDSVVGKGAAVAYEGAIKKRAEIDLSAYRWVVVSYGILRNDFDKLQDWLGSGHRAAVVVDECQGLKNASSVLFRNVKELSNSYGTFLMTGTPMSSPMDAYAPIKIKTPQLYRNQSQFERIHVAEVDFFKSPTKWQNLDLLQKNLRLQCVYRDKIEVHGHLESRTWPIYYNLAPAHMKLYTKLMEEQLLVLDNGGKIDATTAQRLYNAAQQIISNYDYYSGDETARAAVYDLIDEICDEVAVHRLDSSKIIFWTWYTRTTESVVAYLQNYNAVAAYSGANSAKSVERFLTDPTCRILVAQPGSAGAGLNPQYICCEAAFIESPTRTIPFKQAAGRIDREGQKFCANNRILVAANTIQEKLYTDLLNNDDLVSLASGSISSIRSAIFGAR